MPKDGCRNHTFIVRVWSEETGSGKQSDEWRGEVVHVASGKRVYFGDFVSIAGILASMTKKSSLTN